MGQLSGILATLPELVKETVSSLKWLFCKEGKTLATIAKCLLLFKKLLDMYLENVSLQDYLLMQDKSIVLHELSDVDEVVYIQLHSHVRIGHFLKERKALTMR